MFLEGRVVGVCGGAELVDAGVVDQDVNFPRLGGQSPNVVGAVQICRDETCFAACILDFLYGLSPALGTAAVYHDCGTVLGELERHFAPNPGRRASDQSGQTSQ